MVLRKHGPVPRQAAHGPARTPAVATVGSGTGVVTGVTAGTSVITYSVTTGACVNTATKTVTISAPTAQTITGTTPICIGSTQTWTGTTAGGTWTSATPAVATVGSGTGVVTGVTAGTSVITYSVTTGACVNTATKTVTISAPTAQTITGTTPICISSSQTWTGTTAGGTWTSATPAIATVGSGTGVVTGVTAGTSLITYSVTTGACVNTATKTVTISAPTAQTITGTTPICIASSQTWTGTTAGETWTSATPAVATVGSGTGVVTGVTAGTSVITYSVTTGACVNTATKTVTISAPTAQTITGTTPICTGSSQTWTGTTAGGTWTSATPAVATIGSATGIVNGVSVGTSLITYSVTTGACVNTATKTVTIVNNIVPTFTALGPYCSGATPGILLSTSENGITGSWSPSTITTASTGTTTYTFTPTAGQCAVQTTMNVEVNANVTPLFTALGPYCTGAIPGTLSTISNNGITGTWNPATISTASAGTTTYTFTPTIGQCATITVDMSVVVNSNLTPVFTALGPYCVGATPGTLPATSTNGISGSWSPAIVSTISAGTTTYTFTPNAGQCATTNTMAVIVNSLLPVGLTITANPSGALCSGTFITTTAAAVNGGTTPVYQWTLNGDIVGGNSSTYSYTVSYNDTIVCKLTSNLACASNNPAWSIPIYTTVYQTPAAEAGANAIYSGTPILIGNLSNGPGTITWSPAAGLDNPGIAQPTASPAATTIYTLTIDNNGCIATDVVTISVGVLGHTIGGRTRYAGKANSGSPSPNLPTYNSTVYNIDEVIVILKTSPAGAEIARDTSDASGNYQFSNVADGEYILTYDKFTADTMMWAIGVNAIDLSLIKYLITSDTVLDPSRLFSSKYKKAANVDNNQYINSIDVARIKAKIGAPTTAIRNFPKGNWVALNKVVTVAGSNVNVDLETISYGDYDASSSQYYGSALNWGMLKSTAENIIVSSEEYIITDDPSYFEIPLRISSKVNDFSALGLELNYPKGYQLASAYMPKTINNKGTAKINPAFEEIIAEDNDLLVTDENGVIRVVYATTNHFDVAANDEVIVLAFYKLSDFQQEEPEFQLSGTGVIGNQYGEVGDDIYLLMPKILVQGDNAGKGFEFTGYPNPFNGEATLTYDLPENGTVKIKAYNVTGDLVTEIVNEEQISGKHSVKYSPKYLPAGMYTFKLEFTGLTRSECLILKMIH